MNELTASFAGLTRPARPQIHVSRIMNAI